MSRGDQWLWGWGVGYVAIGTISLLIPLYAISLGGNAFMVGVIAATAAFAGVPGALTWGWMADRTDHRSVFIIIALGATGVMIGVIPVVSSVWVLVGVNSVIWFFVAAAAPVLTLLVVEGMPEDRWDSRIALLNAFQGYGWVAGLILGTVWLPFGGLFFDADTAQRVLFWGCSAISFIAIPLAVRRVPQKTTVDVLDIVNNPVFLGRIFRGGGRYIRTVPFATTRLYWGIQGYRSGAFRLELSRRFVVYLGVVLLFSTGFGVFWGPLPVFLHSFFTDQRVFLLFLAANVSSAVFYTRIGRWTEIWDSGKLQSRALLARVVLFPLVGIVTVSIPTDYLLVVLLGIFCGIGFTWAIIAVTATGMVTRLAGSSRGNGVGLYVALTGFGGGIGSITGGWIAGWLGFYSVFGVASVLVLLGVVLFVVDYRAARTLCGA